MSNINYNQALLSERLLLLHKLDDSPYSRAPYRINAVREMKLLDTIALLLSTGLPGEQFAVAFDKRQGVLEVVLAKNRTPTLEDVNDAKELFDCLCTPNLYPFVLRRCRESVLKKIRKLQNSILETGFYDDFYERLGQYPQAGNLLSPNDINREFSGGSVGLITERYEGERLSVALRYFFDGTLGAAQAVSQNLDVEDFLDLNYIASTIAQSYFLDRWVRLEEVGYRKVQRFQRCVEKLCRYVDDIGSLVGYAKRLGGQIRYRWVTDESLGIQKGEEDIRIGAETPLEAASALSSHQLSRLKQRKPSIAEPWSRTVQTSLHAELRLILHFGQTSEMGYVVRPIGLSKASCLCCALWIRAYSRESCVWWETRSRYRPDASWALSAPACPSVRGPDLRRLDEKVVVDVFKNKRWQY